MDNGDNSHPVLSEEEVLNMMLENDSSIAAASAPSSSVVVFGVSPSPSYARLSVLDVPSLLGSDAPTPLVYRGSSLDHLSVPLAPDHQSPPGCTSTRGLVGPADQQVAERGMPAANYFIGDAPTPSKGGGVFRSPPPPTAGVAGLESDEGKPDEDNEDSDIEGDFDDASSYSSSSSSLDALDDVSFFPEQPSHPVLPPPPPPPEFSVPHHAHSVSDMLSSFSFPRLPSLSRPSSSSSSSSPSLTRDLPPSHAIARPARSHSAHPAALYRPRHSPRSWADDPADFVSRGNGSVPLTRGASSASISLSSSSNASAGLSFSGVGGSSPSSLLVSAGASPGGPRSTSSPQSSRQTLPASTLLPEIFSLELSNRLATVFGCDNKSDRGTSGSSSKAFRTNAAAQLAPRRALTSSSSFGVLSHSAVVGVPSASPAVTTSSSVVVGSSSLPTRSSIVSSSAAAASAAASDAELLAALLPGEPQLQPFVGRIAATAASSRSWGDAEGPPNLSVVAGPMFDSSERGAGRREEGDEEASASARETESRRTLLFADADDRLLPTMPVIMSPFLSAEMSSLAFDAGASVALRLSSSGVHTLAVTQGDDQPEFLGVVPDVVACIRRAYRRPRSKDKTSKSPAPHSDYSHYLPISPFDGFPSSFTSTEPFPPAVKASDDRRPNPNSRAARAARRSLNIRGLASSPEVSIRHYRLIEPSWRGAPGITATTSTSTRNPGTAEKQLASASSKSAFVNPEAAEKGGKEFLPVTRVLQLASSCLQSSLLSFAKSSSAGGVGNDLNEAVIETLLLPNVRCLEASTAKELSPTSTFDLCCENSKSGSKVDAAAALQVPGSELPSSAAGLLHPSSSQETPVATCAAETYRDNCSIFDQPSLSAGGKLIVGERDGVRTVLLKVDRYGGHGMIAAPNSPKSPKAGNTPSVQELKKRHHGSKTPVFVSVKYNDDFVSSAFDADVAAAASGSGSAAPVRSISYSSTSAVIQPPFSSLSSKNRRALRRNRSGISAFLSVTASSTPMLTTSHHRALALSVLFDDAKSLARYAEIWLFKSDDPSSSSERATAAINDDGEGGRGVMCAWVDFDELVKVDSVGLVQMTIDLKDGLRKLLTPIAAITRREVTETEDDYEEDYDEKFLGEQPKSLDYLDGQRHGGSSGFQPFKIRLVLRGYSARNDTGNVHVKKISVRATTAPGSVPSHTPSATQPRDVVCVREIMEENLHFLSECTALALSRRDCSSIPPSRSRLDLFLTSLSAMQNIASSTSLLSHVLQTLYSLLLFSDRAVLPKKLQRKMSLLNRNISLQIQRTRTSLSDMSDPLHNSSSLPLHRMSFDPSCMSASGITLSESNTVVKCSTSTHTHVYATNAFTSGVHSWEIEILEDIVNDESVCLGIGTKDENGKVENSSYNSSKCMWMYRCYNGILYKKGTHVKGVTKEKIHPGDKVRLTLDMTARTLRYCINSNNDQGICFTDLPAEIYPAVAFYGGNRSVRMCSVSTHEKNGGKGVVFFHNDKFNRVKWTGSIFDSKMHGHGCVTISSGGTIHGYWRNGSLIGVQAFVRDGEAPTKTASVQDSYSNAERDDTKIVPRTDMVVLDELWQVRQATAADISAAAAEINGWVCALCSFVTSKTQPVCKLCHNAREKAASTQTDIDSVPFTTSVSCIAVIFRSLACLASLSSSESLLLARTRSRNGKVGSSLSSFKSGSQADPQVLHPPPRLNSVFSLEPTPKVFRLILSFLSKYSSSNASDERKYWELITVSALKVLSSNFSCVVAAVPSSVYLLGYLDRQTASTLRSRLEKLMLQSHSATVSRSSAEAMVSGLEILCPKRVTRCMIVRDLLRENIARPFSHKSGGRWTLLHGLLLKYGDKTGLMQLIGPLGFESCDSDIGDRPIDLQAPANPQTREDSVVGDLVSLMFETAVAESLEELRNNEAKVRKGNKVNFQFSSSSPSIGMAATRFLQSYLLQTVAVLSIPSSSASSPSLGEGDSAVSEPKAEKMISYVSLALHSCCNLLDEALLFLRSGAQTTSDVFAAVESWLRSTLVFNILPLLSITSHRFSDQLWFACPLIPFVVNLLKKLDEVNCHSKESKAAEKSLADFEAYEVERKGFGDNSFTGPREVKARFDPNEHSDDVSIEDDGRLFCALQSTHQHCLVDVGVRSGKAAWEFHLLADSDQDECSAFGVANKPISSSSYESSMNMWVRRSYNGQLYHGTSSGFRSMSKIHPNDVIRIEVDMDARTLSFRKNGEDEGVAFVDIEGEVFPIVCTYRTGIQVRLLKTEVWQDDGSMSFSHYSFPPSLQLKTSPLRNHGTVFEDGSSFTHVDKSSSGSWASAVSVCGFSNACHVWNVTIKSCTSDCGIAIGVSQKLIETDEDFYKGQFIDRATHLGSCPHTYAMLGDGTLWANGAIVAMNYGGSKLEGLTENDVIGICCDLENKQIIFALNGETLGVAFGRNGASELFPSRPTFVFPSVSIKHCNDHVIVQPAGLGRVSTVSLFWLLDSEKTLASLGGRLASTLVSGPSITAEETEHENWMRSPMIIGGLESNEELSDEYMVQIASETSTGLKRLVESQYDTGHVSNLYADGKNIHSLSSVVNTLMRLQMREWLETEASGDFEDECFPPGRSSSIIPPQPDLLIRDRILEEIALTSRSKIGTKFSIWMETSAPEPVFLKTRLSANDAYEFPLCEQPFIAALLKHTGLWREAMWLISENSSIANKSPSDNMRQLFGKIKAMRAFLRRRRQLYLVADGGAVGLGKTHFNALCWNIHDRGEFLRGTKVAEASMCEGEPDFGFQVSPSRELRKKKSNPTTADSPSRFHRTRSSPSASLAPSIGVGDTPLDDARIAAVLRSCFSYVVVDCTAAAVSDEPHSAKDTRAVFTSPDPSDLAALLARRKLRAISRCYGFRAFLELLQVLSFDSVSIDALTFLRSSMRGRLGGRTKSSSNTLFTNGFGFKSHSNGLPVRTEQRGMSNEDVNANELQVVHSSSPDRHRVNRDEQIVGGSDLGENSLLLAGFLHRAHSQIASLLERNGLPVPEALSVSDRSAAAALGVAREEGSDSGRASDSGRESSRRSAVVESDNDFNNSRVGLPSRASQEIPRPATANRRGIRLRTVADETMSAPQEAAVTAALPPVPPHSLPAGAPADGASSRTAEKENLAPASLRHHYLKGLESCPAPYLTDVQDAYKKLYRLLTSLLQHAIASHKVGLACFLMDRFGLDYEPRDHEFLLKESIIEHLQPLLSLKNTIACADTSASQQAILIARNYDPQATWSVSDVRNGLASASLTTRMVWHQLELVISSSPTLKEGYGQLLKSPPLSVKCSDIYTTMHVYDRLSYAYFNDRRKERAKLDSVISLEKERAKKERRRRLGIRYTYFVTAGNGVGLRTMPDATSGRTGHSFKLNEIAEVSFRLQVEGEYQNTYLRLAKSSEGGSGWLFNTGIRSPYKGQQIMKCISTEDHAVEEDRIFAAQEKVGCFSSRSQSNGVYLDNYRLVAHRHTRTSPENESTLSRASDAGTSTLWGNKMLSNEEKGGNYFEIIVRCGGAKSAIGIGVAVLSDDNTESSSGNSVVSLDALGVDCDVGSKNNWFGYRSLDGSMWAHGHQVQVKKESDLSPSSLHASLFPTTSVPKADTTIPILKDDTVFGCGVDFEKGVVFFTKGGVCVGTISSPNLPNKVFVPCVSLGSYNEIVELNYGPRWLYRGSDAKLSEPARLFATNNKKCMADFVKFELEPREVGKTVGMETPANIWLGDANDHTTVITASSETKTRSVASFQIMSHSAWSLYRLVCTLAVSLSSSKAQSEVPSNKTVDSICIVEERRSRSESLYGTHHIETRDFTTKLQNLCLDFLLDDLSDCYEGLMKAKSPEQSQNRVRIETHTYERLSFLLTISQYQPCRVYLHDPRFMKCLFALQSIGSQRIHRVVTRLLSEIVPDVSPGLIDATICDMALDVDMCDTSGKVFLQYLLRRISEALTAKRASERCFGSAKVFLASASEDACLYRTIMGSSLWCEVAWDVTLDALRAFNSLGRSSDGGDTSVALAALFVLGNIDHIRIGGCVKLENGSLAVVTDCRSGSDSISVASIERSSGRNADGDETTHHDCLGTTQTVSYRSATPVARVRTPKIPENRLDGLFEHLLVIFPSHSAKAAESSDLSEAIAVQDAICSSGLFHFYGASTLLAIIESIEDDLSTRDATLQKFIGNKALMNMIFQSSLIPIDLPSFVGAPELSRTVSALHETLLESAMLQGANLTTVPSSLRAQPEENSPMLFRVILKEGAVVRTGVSIDESERVCVLKAGTVVEVVEKRLCQDGLTRLRIANGWISDRLRGGSSALVVERVSYAMSEFIALTSDTVSNCSDETALVFNTADQKFNLDSDFSKFPQGGVKHRLHEHPLAFMAPQAIYPDSPGWECDNCGAGFTPDVKSFVSTNASCNWVICMNCFCSDERALGVVRGILDSAVEAEREAKEKKEADRLADERARAAEEAARRDAVLRADADDAMRTLYFNESVQAMTDMGFMEDDSTRSLRAAMRIVGRDILVADIRRRILNQAVDLVMNGNRDGDGIEAEVPPVQSFARSVVASSVSSVLSSVVRSETAGVRRSPARESPVPGGAAVRAAGDALFSRPRPASLSSPVASSPEGIPLVSRIPRRDTVRVYDTDEEEEDALFFSMRDSASVVSSQTTASDPHVGLSRRTTPDRRIEPPSSTITEFEDQLALDDELEMELERERTRRVVEPTDSDSTTATPVDSARGMESNKSGVLYGSPRRSGKGRSAGEASPSSPQSKMKSEGRSRNIRSSDLPIAHLPDAIRDKAVAKLAAMTLFPNSVCLHAMMISGDDEVEAKKWLETQQLHRKRPTCLRKSDCCIYGGVVEALGFKNTSLSGIWFKSAIDSKSAPEVEAARRIVEDVLPSLQGSIEDERGSKHRVETHPKISMSSVGRRGKQSLTHVADFARVQSAVTGARQKANGTIPSSSDRISFGLSEYAVLEKVEVEKTSDIHKLVGVIICTNCRNLEFPGCNQHKMLFSVCKNGKHAKCARCDCATDVRTPWSQGCRLCKGPTDKSFWALSVREAQFLLRAFPRASRQTRDDSCRVKILNCPCCGVVGFPGVGGENPVLAECTSLGDYTIDGKYNLDVGCFRQSLKHIDYCPNTGSLDAIEVSITFGEARYLYDHISNVDTFAKFRSRSGDLKPGMVVAATDSVGPCRTLNSVVCGVVSERASSIGKGAGAISDVFGEVSSDHVCIDVLNEETGLVLPMSVQATDARYFTHMFGQRLGHDPKVGAAKVHDFTGKVCRWLTTLRSRQCVVTILRKLTCARTDSANEEFWRCGHNLFDVNDWAPFIRFIKLVTAGGISGWSSQQEELIEILKSLLRSTSASSDSFDLMELDRRSSLIAALLDDCLSSFGVISGGKGRGFIDSTANGENTVIARESLHPFIAPCRFGEEILFEKTRTITLSLDKRCCLGDGKGKEKSSLKFWRSRRDAMDGKSSIATFQGDVFGVSMLQPSGEDVKEGKSAELQCFEVVIPDVSSLFYIFDAKEKSSAKNVPVLELESTNSKMSEHITIDQDEIVTCIKGFPSIAPKHIALTKGKWYYEVIVVKSGLAQIGWADRAFTGDAWNGKGVGDDTHSWGFDGYRVFKWHKGGNKWGRGWCEGDVIGFLADLDSKSLSFSINGDLEKPLGIAFSDIAVGDGIRPCITMNKSCELKVNFGQTEMKFKPDGYEAVASAADAGNIVDTKRWGYKFSISDYVGLRTVCVTDFDLVCKCAGGISSIWRPAPSSDWTIASLGDIAIIGDKPPTSAICAIDDRNPVLCKPLGFKRIYVEDEGEVAAAVASKSISTLGQQSPGSVWRPLAPEGYVALGDVCAPNYIEPSVDVVRCVRQDHVERCSLEGRISLEGLGLEGRKGVSAVETDSVWVVDNQASTFLLMHGYGNESDEEARSGVEGGEVFGWKLTNVAKVDRWAKESDIITEASSKWSGDMLEFLLGHQNSGSVSKGFNSRGFDVGSGIIPEQMNKIVAVLAACLTSRHANGNARELVTSILTKILRFNMGQLGCRILPCVRSLGLAGDSIVSICRDIVLAGSTQLPKNITSMIELVTTAKWVAMMNGKETGLLPSCRIEKVLTGAAGDSYCEILTEFSKVVDWFSFRTEAAENPRASSSRTSSAMTMSYVVRSWLDVVAFTEIVESEHSDHTTAYELPSSGVVDLQGGEALEIYFDRRCDLSDAELTLTGMHVDSQRDGGVFQRTVVVEKGFDFAHKVCFVGQSFSWTFRRLSSSSDGRGHVGWGFRFMASPLKVSHFSKLIKLSQLRQQYKSLEFWPHFVAMRDWTEVMDLNLVEWLNVQTVSSEINSMDLSPFSFSLSESDLSVGPMSWAGAVDTNNFYLRISLLQHFNRDAITVLPMIDMCDDEPFSVGFKLRQVNGLILRDIKMPRMIAALDQTQGSSGSSTTVTLDNFMASKSLQDEGKTIYDSRCIFVQAFQALSSKPVQMLRTCYDFDRVFQVNFKGEGGSDAGGVFREGMSRIVEDLFLTHFDLFVPCPNSMHDVHLNKEKFIPNPKYRDDHLAMEMYLFVGKMMGVSLRANLCLPFQLPSFVWKATVGVDYCSSDLADIDSLVDRWLRDILSVKAEDDFEAQYGKDSGEKLTWFCTGMIGGELGVLRANGFPAASGACVSFDEREEFASGVLTARVSEIGPAIENMKRGFWQVVPQRSLALFTWKEAEVLVSGTPKFDIALWKEHTHYCGYTAEDVTIKLFWKVLESLTDEEKCGLVRFAWGRSRIPGRGAQWSTNMHISKRGSVDSLPNAHTCFFSIDLPPYEGEEVMRKKLLLAITYGTVGVLNT